MPLHLDTSLTSQSFKFRMGGLWSEDVRAEVRVRQYQSAGDSLEYESLSDWQRVDNGEMELSVPVNRPAVSAGGRTMAELRFRRMSGGSFASGSVVRFGEASLEAVAWVAENRVLWTCEEKDNYRYGYNTQEKVNEVAGLGNHYAAMFWEYDTRLGRRWNLDPKPNVGISNYAVNGNNPISFTDPLGDKEFENYRAYKKELGSSAYSRKEWNGQDGHWLASDRTSWSKKSTTKDNRFSAANDVNIRRDGGSNEYSNLEQREAFYRWFDDATKDRGFQTRWAGAAADAVDKLEWIEGGTGTLASMVGYSNGEIQDWIRSGNKLILDDAWKPLQTLYLGSPLVGRSAYNWDANALLREQQTIDLSYWNLSANSLNILEGSLRKTTGLSNLVSGLKFNGTSILSVTDRWVYGMTIMNYKVTEKNVPIPTECPQSPKRNSR